MTNVALNKPVLGEGITRPKAATNGSYEYTHSDGYLLFKIPGEIIVDLQDIFDIYCIRILLWDGKIENAKPDGRKYQYLLSISTNKEEWKNIYNTSEQGSTGWQIYDFPERIPIRYIKINGLKNTVNEDFHIVEIEAHSDKIESHFENIGLQYSINIDNSDNIQFNPFINDINANISTITNLYNNYNVFRGKNINSQYYDFKFISEQLIFLDSFLKLLNIYKHKIPFLELEGIIDTFKKLLESIDIIYNFDDHLGVNPANQYFNVCRGFIINFNTFYLKASPYILYLEKPDTTVENIRELFQKAQNVLKEIESKSIEIDSETKSLKESIANLGVSKYAVCFENQSKIHKQKSFIWLGITLLFVCATLGFSIASLYGEQLLHLKYTDFNYINIAVSKFAIFTLLTTATIWCGNIYKSHWHNYIVNQHRQNAMSTFEIFFKSSENEEIKNAILLQSSQAIFTLQHSGFLRGNQDSGNQTQILEIVRGMAGSVDKTN